MPVSIRAMFLRSITIRGFKSFADKTVLEFVPGVSVIVGPNGSGKSNLVDAISWALGEQGARALRGGHMADVIFAGTPSRPALGMAEVKLVIDNAAGKIPVPMTEIEISRTIFRSGESEYRIGGQVVRLLDVQELLSETGIGRALHTVVGQGQLEEVLLARPEERRSYIEEAAGIAKHRRRKERAERKLAGLDQDLLRLADVLTELRRQLKPLQQQAESAKKHESLTAEADALAGKLAAARLRALLRERERRKGGWDQGLEERRSARERLDALDTEVLAAADARAEATTALADAERAFRAAAEDRERAEQTYRDAVDEEAAARQALAGEAARRRADGRGHRGTRSRRGRRRDRGRRPRAQRIGARRRRGGAIGRRRTTGTGSRRSAGGSAKRPPRVALRPTRSAARSRAPSMSTSGSAGRSTRSVPGSQPRRPRAARSKPTSNTSTDRPRRSRSGDGQLDDERRRARRPDRAADRGAACGCRPARTCSDARRRDIEETPGSRFLAEHGGRAVGLLKDLVRDRRRARARARRGARAARRRRRLRRRRRARWPTRRTATARSSRSRPAVPCPSGSPGERQLLAAVDAEPAARGIVSTVLRDVYLAATSTRPRASKPSIPRRRS